jgi:DNA repair protein RadA/Sms
VATKAKVRYVCSECGGVQMKWMGKCPDCDEWNTLEEVVVQAPAAGTPSSSSLMGTPEPISLPAIPAEPGRRLVLSNGELNRVLGGGIVPGSGILVGGDPGIGKSTLLLQMAADVAG